MSQPTQTTATFPLAGAVRTLIASQRLGTPVFARIILQGPAEGPAVLARLSRLAALVQEWLGQKLDRYHVAGSLETGQVNLMLQFSGSGLALVSYARGELRGDGLDLILLGNQGAAYHDAGAAAVPAAAIDLTGPAVEPLTEARLLAALQTGQPVALAGGAAP